ncbi:MAG: hypothetical protein ACIPMY_02125 [Rickettsia endosymbiont of Pentastiridius leporinus]
MVIKHLLAVKQDYDYEKDNDFQDLNETLGIALYKIGRKKEALEYLEKTTSNKLANEIKMDLAIDSNELVLRNQADQNNNSEVPNHLIVQAIYKLNQTQMQHGERLNNVEQEIFKIQQKLCIAGIETQSNINATINSIRITNPKLYKYYSYFNSGLQNIYIASQVIDSKLVVPDADHMERKKWIVRVLKQM